MVFFSYVDALEQRIDMMNLTVAFHNFATPLQMRFKCTESLWNAKPFEHRVAFITLLYIRSKHIKRGQLAAQTIWNWEVPISVANMAVSHS
jgi:hypothetical protein